MLFRSYAHILDEDRKVNAQRFEEAFYANCDLRKVTPPDEKPLTPDVTNIVQLLQGSPELTSMLSNLIAKAGVKAN